MITASDKWVRPNLACGHAPQFTGQWRASQGLVSQNAEYQPDGPVDLSCPCCVEAACEVTQSVGIDRAHLIDEHTSPCSVHLDLWPEDRGLRTGGSRGDDQRGKQNPVTLDRDCVPGAALLMPGGFLAGA